MAYEEWHKNKWNWRLYPEYNKILKTLQNIEEKEMKIFNKLVRDKIPEIIIQKGEYVETKILDRGEYILELNKKLKEEVDEFIIDQNEEEIADILEVIDAIISVNGFSYKSIIRIKNEKKKNKGGFEKKVFLIKKW